MTKPKPTSWSVAVACKGRGGESGTAGQRWAGAAHGTCCWVLRGQHTAKSGGRGTVRVRHCGGTIHGRQPGPAAGSSLSQLTHTSHGPTRPAPGGVGPGLSAAAAAREPREGSGPRFSPSSPCYRAEQGHPPPARHGVPLRAGPALTMAPRPPPRRARLSGATANQRAPRQPRPGSGQSAEPRPEPRPEPRQPPEPWNGRSGGGGIEDGESGRTGPGSGGRRESSAPGCLFSLEA